MTYLKYKKNLKIKSKLDKNIGIKYNFFLRNILIRGSLSWVIVIGTLTII